MANKSRSIYDCFGYEQINGVWFYGKSEYNAGTKSFEFIRYGRYIAVEQVSIDMDGGSPILRIAYETLDGETKSVCIEKSLLGKKRELQSLLLQCDADAHDGGMKVLPYCLHNSEESASRGRCYHRTGWLHGKRLAFKGRTLIAKDASDSTVEYVGSYDLSMKGTFAAWKNMVKQEVLGNAPLELAILVGLSPIISSRWGARNLIIHFMGDSGTGKTTSAILALSTIGCPNPAETAKSVGVDGKPLRTLMSSWKGTSNALIGKLDGLDGTLMVFDELSKIEDDRVLTSTIYALSDGADKDRMTSPTELQTTNQIRTNILSLGEESLLERAKSKNSGINVRVCEISTEFTSSAEQSEEIVRCCYVNYGHAGSAFVRYIVEHMSHDLVAELREENLNEFEAALLNGGCKSKTPRRLAEFGAVLLTVADIATKALKLNFSRQKIIDLLVDQQVNSDSNTEIGLRAHAALKGFITKNAANFVVGECKSWAKNIPCYGKIELNSSGAMCEVSIETGQFEQIMNQLSFSNPSLVIQQLKSNGLLNHEARKNYRKRTLISDVGPVRVYAIKFP